MNNSLEFNDNEHQLHNTNLGDIYLFENYVITNFNEGVDIHYENFYEVGVLLKNHFKEKPFGYIANRNNSYSINLSDVDLFNEAFPNLKAYAIVVYSSLTEKVFEIENHFFTFNRQAFKAIDDAIDWVEKTLPFHR